MRHGKSDRDQNVPDFERPLAKRGREDVPVMGKMLLISDNVPEIIISSPAKRAMETAELVAKACRFKGEIRYEDSFYQAVPEDIIEVLRSLNDKVQSVMVVGHNPDIEKTAAYLSCRNANAVLFPIPTAGLLCFDSEIEEWGKLTPNSCILRWFVIPKLIGKII